MSCFLNISWVHQLVNKSEISLFKVKKHKELLDKLVKQFDSF